MNENNTEDMIEEESKRNQFETNNIDKDSINVININNEINIQLEKDINRHNINITNIREGINNNIEIENDLRKKEKENIKKENVKNTKIKKEIIQKVEKENTVKNEEEINNINEKKREIIPIEEKENIKNKGGVKKEEKIDFKRIAKDYISKSSNDTEYVEMIKSKPLSIFELITEQKLDNWETLLNNICPLTFQITENKDQEILDYPLKSVGTQANVILNDSKRTRVRESILYPNFLETLQKVLRYYCDKYKILYKQGLNEIFGPLILMKYKLKNLSLTSVVNIGAMIIDSFLPNYFYEKEIYSLKSALGLFITLLKYHDPTVFNKLDTFEVRPEIYATNWLVTYLSGKLSLNIFYYIWDRMIKIEDPLFIQFILVAIIKENRELIINCDINLLAVVMTSLTIRTKEELDKIIKIAYQLREQTPYSFRLLADKIGFLKKKFKDIKINYEKYQPELLPAMPIFPAEVLYITYKSQIYCIDPKCKNYAKEFGIKNNIISRGESRTIIQKSQNSNYMINQSSKPYSKVEKIHFCEKCDIGIEKKMQYILLDLRILEYGEYDDTEKTGFIPSMISVSQEELKSEDFSEIITNRFNSERGNYHFIFLTTCTDTFTDFESNYYMENITEEDRRKMMFGVIEQKKIDKALDINNAKKKLSLKQIYKLKEYDNMRNTLKSMTKHNYPYVGYVYGGFNLLHKEAPKFKVELIGHNEEICLLCKDENNKNSTKEEKIDENKDEKDELYNVLWEHKQKIKYSNLDEFFNNPNNRMHLCILKEYKKKDIDNNKVQILINELFDKFEIEIYKFDIKKQYDDFETTILIKKKKEKQKYYDYGKEEDNDENNKDLELTLLERVPVFDILSITQNHKSKNIVTCDIRGEIKKEKMFGLFKKKETNYETITMIFDFSSTHDSKNFILSFKEMISKYKAQLNKKTK